MRITIEQRKEKSAVMEAREVFQDQPDQLFDKEVNELLDRWQQDKDELYNIKQALREGGIIEFKGEQEVSNG